MFGIGPNLSSQYFGLSEEVNALAAFSAIAPNIQTTNAIATWATDQVGPLSDHNLLVNSTVLIDQFGDLSGVNSEKFELSTGITDAQTVWINQVDGHLYRGTNDLEASFPGTGDVSSSIGVSTDNYVACYDSTSGKLIKQAAIDTTGNDLSIVTPGAALRMYNAEDVIIESMVRTNADSTTVGFQSSCNAGQNTFLGYKNDHNNHLDTSSVVGAYNFSGLTGISSGNSCVGFNCAPLMTAGSFDTMIGRECLKNIATADNTIALGNFSGFQLLSSTNGIYLGDQTCGTSETGIMRLGHNSTANTYVKGILNNTPNPTSKLVGVSPINQVHDTSIFSIAKLGNLSMSVTNQPSQAIGVTNVINYGTGNLLVATTAATNVLTGISLLTSATNGCNNNMIHGSSIFPGATSAMANNVVMGSNVGVGAGITNVTNCVLLGASVCNSINGANKVIALGSGTGVSVTSNSTCIYLDNSGVAAEVGSIRIGTQGAYTSCYLSGITSSSLSNRVSVVMDSVSGRLGYVPVDVFSTMELAFENYTTPYTRSTTINTPVELGYTGTALASDPINWDVSVAGRIKWVGTATVVFQAIVSCSGLLASGVNTDVEFFLAKGGVKVPLSAYRRQFASTSEYQCVTWPKNVTLTTGEYVSIFVTNLSGSNSINFGNINLVLQGEP